MVNLQMVNKPMGLCGSKCFKDVIDFWQLQLQFRLESVERQEKQFLALRENIAHFVLFMFASLKNWILERLEVTSRSGLKIEFKFEFSLPSCQLIELGSRF